MQQSQQEQMLQQIRNLLVPNSHKSKQPLRPASDDQISKYLSQSYRMVEIDGSLNEKSIVHNNNGNTIINSKINQASVLLNQESSMIKNYVRDKIQSEFFGGRTSGETDRNRKDKEREKEKEIYKLMQMRQQLERKRLEEKVQEQKKISSMIESARKYKRYQSKSEVPLDKLGSLLHKQNDDFDMIQKEDFKVKSTNNSINSSQKKLDMNQFNNQTKYQNFKKQLQRPETQNFIIEIHGTEENQQDLYNKMAQQYYDNFTQKLQKNKNFVNAFAKYLQLQLKKIENEDIVQDQTERIQFQNEKSNKKKFKFPKSLLTPSPLPLNPVQIGLGQLSRSYKFQAFIEQKQQQSAPRIKMEQIKKLINKRNGQSNKYHMKQCILQNNMLYYTDEQNTAENTQLEDMKILEIMIEPLSIVKLVKEEGNFFQKREVEIDAVVVKGRERVFTYELGLAEGQQLADQINKMNLRRLHKMSCLANADHNKNMEKFIEGEHQILDFSQKYIKTEDQCPIKNYRTTFLKLLKDLFPKRKTTQILNFQKCKLSFTEINQILKQCQTHFTSIIQINMSKTKLDKQTFKNVLSLSKKCPQGSTMKLNLSHCQINDDIIQSNIVNLQNSLSKISNLELSHNELSQKSLKSLKNPLSSKICQLQTLNLSWCPLQSFPQVSNLIKTSNKLCHISLNSCNLSLNNYKLFQNLMLHTQQKQQLKKIQIKYNNFMGNAKWFEEMSSWLEIEIDYGNFGGRDGKEAKQAKEGRDGKGLESKYLRVVEVRGRGD